jgi:hypothetical protein
MLPLITAGQHMACSSMVTNASIGLSSVSNSTAVTAPPARPNSRVESLVKRGLPSILQVSATRMITEGHGHFSGVNALI